MTGKERVLCALRHEEADRVPTGENNVDGLLAERILERPLLFDTGWRAVEAMWEGRRDELARDCAASHVELVAALEWDYVRVPTVAPPRRGPLPRMTGPDSWVESDGREYQFSPAHGNIITQRVRPDMRIDDLPDPDAPFAVDPIELDATRSVVAEIGSTNFVIGRSPVDGSFPYLQTVGMEELLVRMVEEEPFVRRAVEAYTNRSLAYIRAFAEAGVDAVMTTDDYCDNRGPIMGPHLFRKYILPAVRRQVEEAHSLGIFFVKHTDGLLWDILDDLVDAGIDAWHGIQQNIGMDLAQLKRRYRGRLCLFGGVNTDTLIEGTPEQAAAEARAAISAAGPSGGLVVACSNVLQPGTRLECYLAAREAVRRYGRYPLG